MLVECVANFSEGRRPEVVAAIVEAARAPGVSVLDASADADHHRSVVTFAGEGAAVAEGAFRAVAVAVAQIDLRQHRGTHPRIGAADVVPFVPLGDTPMAYCVALAESVGARIAAELNVPVYLYGDAARRPARRELPRVRRGEFEGLRARMADPAGRPDFGPAAPHPTAGAVAVGARPALIAFNVWLATPEVSVADAVARAVRGSSGGLVGVRALPMDTARRGQMQVSMNLVDFRRTPMPAALEMVRREAARFGVAVAGSEVVGMVPLAALLASAQYYLQAHELTTAQVLELQLLDLAAVEPAAAGERTADGRRDGGQSAESGV